MTPNWDFPKNGYPKLRPMFWSSGILFQKSWKFGSLKVLKKKKKKKKKKWGLKKKNGKIGRKWKIIT
jgi:hypothetical protein